jgi:glyceraldehyde 3-phosphate dehydrogenase
MSIRIGINGFGRMGKLGRRAGWGFEELEIIHINEIKGDAICHVHLLEFDSQYMGAGLTTSAPMMTPF